MTRCPAHWLGCHRYEAVYDEAPDEGAIAIIKAAVAGKGKANGKTVRLIYIQSVCRRCGDVIERMGKAT